jgi:NAD-dependent SIR2 family protein deacetylase
MVQELFPGNYLPTPTHYFMKLLHDKGLLLRCFTQARRRLQKEMHAATLHSECGPAWQAWLPTATVSPGG